MHDECGRRSARTHGEVDRHAHVAYIQIPEVTRTVAAPPHLFRLRVIVVECAAVGPGAELHVPVPTALRRRAVGVQMLEVQRPWQAEAANQHRKISRRRWHADEMQAAVAVEMQTRAQRAHNMLTRAESKS